MKTLLVLFFVLSLISQYYCYDREIHCSINPGCTYCNYVNVTLFYMKAVGQENVIHHLWDFTLGKPTLLFAVTDLQTDLNITWQNATIQDVVFTNKPHYSFGVIINKIWEFDDVNDTGVLNPSDLSHCTPLDLGDMVWNRYAIAAMSEEALVGVRSNMYGPKENMRRGTIDIKLTFFPYVSYGYELPHLIHSANSSLIDLQLVNLTTNPHYNQSRYALELLLISTEKGNTSHMDVNFRKGLDDEHTPGIFEIIEFITPKTEESGDGGFVQFRPVSYVSHLRDVSTSTPVSVSNMSVGGLPEGTLAGRFFAYHSGSVMVNKVYISFGAKGDGYYDRSKYNIWSFTMGYGQPPLEGFSLFVILIISIGLGIPVFLLVVGGICVFFRRRANHPSNQPEILVED